VAWRTRALTICLINIHNGILLYTKYKKKRTFVFNGVYLPLYIFKIIEIWKHFRNFWNDNIRYLSNFSQTHDSIDLQAKTMWLTKDTNSSLYGAPTRMHSPMTALPRDEHISGMLLHIQNAACWSCRWHLAETFLQSCASYIKTL